jgi:4-diphosphocytidyl-2-C-methyl-D-erythritol kinase
MTDPLTLDTPLRLFAPAKINLGLEVTCRRKDGYHEVVTLLESISIFDVIELSPSDAFSVHVGFEVGDELDLVERAIRLVQDAFGLRFGLKVHITKSIPIAAGLGGGSSDAGTVLSAIQRIFRLDEQRVSEIATLLGSDVPFFQYGGTALASGTGTDLLPIRSASRRWYVVVAPDLAIPDKTRHMYGALKESDFTDGSRTRSVARRIESGASLSGLSLRNAFERPLRKYGAVRQAIAALESAGARHVTPSGAGPSVFAVFDTYQDARLVACRIRPDTGQVFVATSVGPDLNSGHLTVQPKR